MPSGGRRAFSCVGAARERALFGNQRESEYVQCRNMRLFPISTRGRALSWGQTFLLWGDRRLFEYCAENVTNIEAALRAGADRIELCDNLAQGRNTPSAGVIEQAVRIVREHEGAELRVIIRPRRGNFDYSKAEMRACAILGANVSTLGRPYAVRILRRELHQYRGGPARRCRSHRAVRQPRSGRYHTVRRRDRAGCAHRA